jgi:hypothetical protein
VKIIGSALAIALTCVFVFSQNLPVDNLKKGKETKTKTVPKELKTDTIPKQIISNTETDETGHDAVSSIDTSGKKVISKDIGESTEESDFINPFISGDEGGQSISQDAVSKEEISDTVDNTLLNKDHVDKGEDSFDETEGGLDILVDLAVGMSLPRFEVTPDYITAKGKPSILFSSGIVIPFAKYFYADIAVRYLQLACNKSEYDTTDSDRPKAYSETKTKESLAFVSAPIKAGMQFELGMFTPYFYADLEPAYLVAGGQFVKEKVNTIFIDGNQSLEESEENINTTKLRERHQVFVGGGIGCLISYGYGYIYVDASFQYATRESGDSEGLKESKPLQLSERVFYFPIVLGLRFFL